MVTIVDTIKFIVNLWCNCNHTKFILMATIGFFVRSEKKKGNEVNIWLRLRNGRQTDIQTTTGITIPADCWHEKKGQPKDLTTEDQELKKRLEMIESRLKGIKTSILTITGMFESITPELVRSCIKSYLDSQMEKISDVPQTMSEYIPNLISKMKDGSLLVKGKSYTKGTINAWNSFNKAWKGFQTDYLKKELNFSNITMDIYTDFVKYCDNVPYKESTKCKYITSLKVVLNYAYDDGISTNLIHKNRNFSKQKRVTDGKKAYLNETELEKLFNLDLKSEKPIIKKVRDIFLIGCYTGQRVSDYSNIKKNNIDKLSNGKKVFRLKQQKTGTSVVIPFLSNNIETILKRWNYELPKISEQIINKEIKNLCGRAKITDNVVIKEIIGGVEMERISPKNKLVCTHTARRSCITNLYLTGVLDTRELMSISGHKTEKSFNEYLCFTDDEMAAKIAHKIENIK